MKYNTKDIYFGCITFNAEENGIWRAGTEAFVKNGEKYIKIKSKNNAGLVEYIPGTDEYLTVSELYPIVNMMKGKTDIPEEISTSLINLYLMKHKINKKAELNRINRRSVDSRTK